MKRGPAPRHVVAALEVVEAVASPLAAAWRRACHLDNMVIRTTVGAGHTDPPGIAVGIVAVPVVDTGRMLFAVGRAAAGQKRSLLG